MTDDKPAIPAGHALQASAESDAVAALAGGFALWCLGMKGEHAVAAAALWWSAREAERARSHAKPA